MEELIAFEKANPLKKAEYKGYLSRLSMFADSRRITPSLLVPSTEDDLTKKMGTIV